MWNVFIASHIRYLPENIPFSILIQILFALIVRKDYSTFQFFSCTHLFIIHGFSLCDVMGWGGGVRT